MFDKTYRIIGVIEQFVQIVLSRKIIKKLIVIYNDYKKRHIEQTSERVY